MNSIAVPVVSIDVPSGVSADTGSADKNAVQAGYYSYYGTCQTRFVFVIRQLN